MVPSMPGVHPCGRHSAKAIERWPHFWRNMDSHDGARGRAQRPAPASPHGTSARNAVLKATPCTAPASCTANWNHRLTPEAPPGHAATEYWLCPATLVSADSPYSGGTGTSVPPLKGAGVLASETNSMLNADGAALPSDSDIGVPATSVPVPLACGAPAPPASAEPRSVHTAASGGDTHISAS